ncbi:MAG: hypothetical protein ABSA92_11370 [Candidatus Bathyarchaeia archaeon]|jgi:hypothetical protein
MRLSPSVSLLYASFPGPAIYHVASGTSYSQDFHPITTGSNGYYSAAYGWNPVTGWGTPVGDYLALDLSNVHYAVCTYVSPSSSAGSFSLDGVSYSDLQVAPIHTGHMYQLAAQPSSGYVFEDGIIVVGTLQVLLSAVSRPPLQQSSLRAMGGMAHASGTLGSYLGNY